MFFQDFNCLYSRSLKCSLHITSYALRIRVSVTHGVVISHNFNVGVTFLLRVVL